MQNKSQTLFAQMTTKGRVTIPKVLRDKYGIMPGTQVLFERVGNVLKITPLGKTKRR
jgi:AbrB family looped-hinge helix DNA binding protein